MKYTISVTQKCNLACKYCYVDKYDFAMSLNTASKVVDFIFENTPAGERIDIGFFGGEPLLVFDLVQQIAEMIVEHPAYPEYKVYIDIVSNGTIFSDDIAKFLREYNIGYCLSCDGPALVQDKMRCFRNGKGSSALVEANLKHARSVLPSVLVNAVYHPLTYSHMPQVVEYFSAMGLRQIYLNPDFTASWSREDAESLASVYKQVAKQYIEYYIEGKPHYISLIDSKIAVILRGGFKASERCRMGQGEFAFGPSGNIYLCERLIGNDSGGHHCIGNVHNDFDYYAARCQPVSTTPVNNECVSCGIKDYCTNWCGCSNYFSSGSYNRVGPFLCASEKAAIFAAFYAFNTLEQEIGPSFLRHLIGAPAANSLNECERNGQYSEHIDSKGVGTDRLTSLRNGGNAVRL
ncbi:MAG: radical SAM protein [Candidatus Saccharibacteria bacterium]